MPFQDANIPADFAPFGIQNIDGKLYVKLCQHKAPDNVDDQSGPGNGYVDIYNTDGSFVSRFCFTGTLNSPVGNGTSSGRASCNSCWKFRDGHISVFDSYRNILGQLKDERT